MVVLVGEAETCSIKEPEADPDTFEQSAPDEFKHAPSPVHFSTYSSADFELTILWGS